ncbi:MAG: hypothetical protein LBU10_03630, partial [Endomicrobium sp.]|nr:hypothetical protein [Endomicrobium sp.]
MHCFVECTLNGLSVLFKRFLSFILNCKQWYYELNSVKIVSIILINCLLLTFVYGQSIAQVTQNIKATEQFKQIFNDFTLPYSYGKITSANYAGSDTVIINIQDLHLHPEAQKNISNIISTFDKEFGLQNIYLEGAYGQVDTSWLANIKEKGKKEETINSVFATGALTGAEYYSAMSNKPMIIKGLESQAPYLNNLKRFGDILYAQDEITKVFNSMESNVKYLKSLYFNRKQNKIEELSKRYISGDLEAKKYFILLNKYADSLGVDLKKYENISLYIELLSLGRQIDYERSTKELQLLILKLKELLPYGAYKMILDSTSDFSDIDRLYTYLVRLSRKNNIDLSVNFPELNKFFNYVELSEKINPMDMLKEEQRLKEELNIAFAYDTGEKEIAFLSGFMPYLKDYLSSKITSDDYNYYGNNIKKFKRLWTKYIDNQKLKSLSKYENTAEMFYKINLDRNNYFIENIDIIKDSSKISKEFTQDLSEADKVIQSLKEAKNVSMVITGGFHTQGVCELLKEQGISYVVITPNVSGEVKLAEDVYYALAKEQSKILFQALATLNLTQVQEELKPVMLTEILTQKRYTIEAINEALKTVLTQGETAQLTGSLNNLDTLELKISRNGQTTAYNYKDSGFEVKPVSASAQTQEEAQVQGNQKSRSSIWSSVKSFIAISAVSAAIVAGSSVAIGLAVVTGFFWFLAPLIFFGLLFIGNMFFMGYELYQDSFLAKEDSTPSDVPEGMTDVYMFKKLLQSLPQDVAKEFAAAALQVPLDSVDSLLYGYASDLAKRLQDLNLTDVGAAMETGNAGIKINYAMIRSKFFDKSGKNIVNQPMLEVFVKHELRHESFRTSTVFFGKFVHSRPWLEELIVSAGDLFTAIGNFFRNLFGSAKLKQVTEINLNSYTDIEQSLTILLGRDSREISQKIQTFCMLNPNINLTEEIFTNLGFSKEDAKVLAGVKFNLNVNAQSLNFGDMLSSSQPLELVKQLINTGNPDAVVVARAMELLGYTSADTFEGFKSIARGAVGDTYAAKFKELKETLIQEVNNNVVAEIIRNEQTLSEVFSKGFFTPQLIALQNMLAWQDINENDIKTTIENFYVANNQTVISFQGLFESLVRQKLSDKLYALLENILPQEFKTQQTKNVLFETVVTHLSVDLGNLTEALVNAKELLLKQVIDKNQNELDLLSVSVAKQKQNVTETEKNNLAVLDRDINNALKEYSFGVVDQSQYNQQALEFVNTIKGAFITENSWEQLKSKETRDNLVNFLKQYYDARIVESNIRFFESITSKNEALGTLSRLLATLVKNRRIYNDVNLQRALADIFPLSMQYSHNTMLNGQSLILQDSIDQEGLVSDIKTYMLILADLNSFSRKDTPEKQKAQSLIANYGKYALSVLDYTINNGSVAFKSGSTLKDIRTSLFNIVKNLGVDVSNIEHPQDRLFAQQQPQLTQAEQERLLTKLPVEIENLEKQTRETKNDKQLLKNLIDSQGKLDDAIFAGENVFASARRMVSSIRNIMQTVIDKGDFNIDDVEHLKDLAQQCKANILANSSDPDLSVDIYDAMVIVPLDILIMQKSANAIDIKKALSILSAAVDGLLRLQANFKAVSFEHFLKDENDTNINFALKEGEVSNLYLALTFSRFATVLNDLGSAYQTLTTDLETAVTSRQQTAIILERLRYWLPAGSAAKEFARIDLVNTVNDTISKFQEVLSDGKGSSPRITLANLNTLKSLQLVQSDYQQAISQIEQPSAYTIPEERVTEATSVTTQTESQEGTQQTQDLSQSEPQATEEQTLTQEEQVSQKEPKETTQGIKIEEKAVQQIQELSDQELKDTDDLKQMLTREKIDTATQDKILFEIAKQRMTHGNDYESGSQAIEDYLLKEYKFSRKLARQISKIKLSTPKFDDIFSSVNLQNAQLFQLLSEKLIDTMYPEAMQTGDMINFLLKNNVLNSQELQGFIRSVTGKNDIEKFEDIKLKLEKEIFKTAVKQFSTGTIKEGILGQVPPTTSRLLGLWKFASKLNSEVFDEDSIKFLKSVLNTDFYFGKEIVEFCDVKFPSLFINSLFVNDIDSILKPEEKQKVTVSLKQNKESLFDAQPTPYYLAVKKFDPDFAKTILDERIAKELNRNVNFFNILKGILSDSPYLKGILSSLSPTYFARGSIRVHLDKNVKFLNSLLDTNLYFGKGLVEFINDSDPEYFMNPDFLKIARKILKQEELDRIASYIIKQKENKINRNISASEGDAIGVLASSEFIRTNFPQEIEYYEVFRVANDNKKLLDYLQDKTQELRYRLYAFAQLKSRGVQDVDGVNVDTVAMALKNDIEEMLQAKSLKHTESYFDLRALITGINLIASEKVIQEVEQVGFKDKADKIKKDEQSMYQQILQAGFIEGESFNADSNLNFVRNLEGIQYFGKDPYDAYYTVIAHELGHRYLFSLGVSGEQKAVSMFHEQFADSVSGVFNSFLFQKDISELSMITSESKGFKVFAVQQTEEAGTQEVQAKRREASSQEEHSAARGLMNSIKVALGAMGKQFNFRALLKASIVLAITGTQALFGVGQQAEVAKEVILGVSRAMVEVDPNFDRGEFLHQFIKEEGVGFKNLEEEQKVFGRDAKGQQALYDYLVAKHKNEKEPALLGNDLYDEELRFIDKYNSEHIQERESVVEKTQQKATKEKETKEEVQPIEEISQAEQEFLRNTSGAAGPTRSAQTILQQPSFANQVSYATETGGTVHSFIWWVGVILGYLTILPAAVYWLFRLFSYLFGPTAVDKLLEKANKLEDSTTKNEELLNAVDSVIVELEHADPTNAKEIERKRLAVAKIAVALNKLIVSPSLSQAQKEDLKQKLIVVTEEKITLTKMVFTTTNKAETQNQIQTMFRQLMVDSVNNSIDTSLLHNVSSGNIVVNNKLIDVLKDTNLSNQDKLLEIKNIMTSITSSSVSELDEFFNNSIISKTDLNEKRAGLGAVIFIVAKILSNKANLDADNLMLSVLLSKIAFDITDVKKMLPTTISQNVVTLANTLNKLAFVYELQGNTAEQNNIKNMLSTMLQQEISVTDGISQGYAGYSSDSYKDFSKKLLESRVSLEKILSKLNISDTGEQALRYIRQRNEVLMNEIVFDADVSATSVYKGTLANLDELIAYTAPESLIQEQFPYDAGYFEILRISQDDQALLDIMQDTNKEMRYRLYAFAQLKSRGVQGVNGVNIDVASLALKDGVKTMLQAKSLKHTESYFDLRVLVIGINLVASGEVIKEVEQAGFKDKADKIIKDEQSMYQNALKANFVAGDSFNADSGLNFVRSSNRIKLFGTDVYDAYYTVIAHELGHRYLYSLDVSGEQKAVSMFHEQFADSVSGVFNSFLFQNDISKLSIIASSSKTFKAFRSAQRVETQSQEEIESLAKTREESSQEEHSAARGLMNSIKVALKAMGKQFDFRALLRASIVLAVTGQALLFGVGQQVEVAREVVFGVSSAMEEIDPNFDKGEFIYQFISKEGVKFKNFQEEQAVFRDNNEASLVSYLNAKQRHNKTLSQEEQAFLSNVSVQSGYGQPVQQIGQEGATAGSRTTVVTLGMQESIASARFTSITAGVLAFFNTGGFVALVVLLSLSIITGLGAVIAAAIGASVLAIIGTISIMSSIYESNQKRSIKELEKSGAVLSEHESRLVFAKLVRSLPQETAIKFVQAVFDNVNLVNDYLNIVSGTNWQNDIETNEAIVNALNGAVINNNSVVMETTDAGKILFSPYIVRALLNNPTMLRVVVEHELHHLEYAKSTSGLRRFIHRIFPGLEEFIVSFRNVFRWFRTKLQDSWRESRGVSVVWNLPEGLALGDILVKKVNEQGFIDAPNIQTGHVQLVDGRRGTLSYKVTRNGLEVPNFEFGKTKFDAKDIGNVEITYTFMPDTYTLSFATNDASSTPVEQEIKNGEPLKINAVANLPQRVGYKFNGYKYVNSEGEVRTITSQEVADGFDIPSSDVTGDLKLQALWDAERSDVIFVDDTGTPIINVVRAAVTGQNVRIAGLGMFSGFRRLGNALVGSRTGIKTQKITWVLPEEISAPKGLPSAIDDSVALNAPLIAEGRVQLEDGRFGAVKRTVKIDGKIVENFQFGTTPINGKLDIEYTFTPERYNINFVANGADSNVPQAANNVLSDRELYHVNATPTEQLPTKSGYLFKGYTYTTNDGRTINVSRMDVVNGVDIDAADITGDISFVAQWDQKEEGEQYEVEFANASIASNVTDNLTLKAAVFGKPYIINHDIIKSNVTHLTADKWEVTGYVVSVNGVDIMKVDVNDINSIRDVTVPVQDVVGKLNIRFLRNPKITFVDKFSNTSNEVAVESGSFYTLKDLNEKIKPRSTKGKVPHWSRSDGKRLGAPITEPVTFTYSEEFHNITDYETQSGKPSSNIFLLIAKGIAKIFKMTYDFIVSPTPVSKLTIVKNAFKNLSWQDGVRLVFSGFIVVSVIVLFVLFSGPGLFGLFFIAALIIAGAIFAVTLLGPVAKGYFRAVRDNASTEKERQKYAYYLEVLDFILGILNSKASTSKAFTAAKVITYFAITAIVALGFLGFVFGFALTSLWFVIAASAVFAILAVGLVIFLIIKYKTSLAFKLLVNVITALFKSGSWKFKLNVAIGLLVSIGAFGVFLIAPVSLGLSFIILLTSLVFLVATVVLFFTNNYNLNRLDQSLRNVLLENFASKDTPHVGRIKNIIGALEEQKWAEFAWNSIALALGIDVDWTQVLKQTLKQTLKQVGQGILNASKVLYNVITHPIQALKQVGQGILSVSKVLYNAIVHPIQTLKQVGQGILSVSKWLYNIISHPVVKLITKGAYVFGKQWATEAIQSIYTSGINAAREVKNVVVAYATVVGACATEAVTYATNVYDNMTDILPSLDRVPGREGFKFDGYEITSENSDIKTIISAEQANTDFVVPANMVNGKVIIRVRWKPNISINTGDGTRSKLYISSKEPLEADASNGVVNLVRYASMLTPPAGYDYGTLYWTSGLFPERTFASNEVVMVDKPGSFTPHWKPLPQVRVSIGFGNWKNRTEGDTSTQREAQVVANRLGGSTVDLKKLSKELQAPQDCDPNSLYWVTDIDTVTPITNGIVTATQNTTYIPRWKKLAEVGKIRIKTLDGTDILGTRKKDGTIDLASISRKLKTPSGYIEGSLYWTSDTEPAKRFTGIINAEDAKNISVLTPHWVENPLYQDNVFSNENYADMDASFTSHPIKFFSGVMEGQTDNVEYLPPSLVSGFSQSDGGYTFPGFTNSLFDMGLYWVPQRAGYKFSGVKVVAKDRKGQVVRSWNFDAKSDGTMDAFNIENQYAIGPLEITMQWISEQDFAKQQEEAKESIRQEDDKTKQEFRKSVDVANERRQEQERKIKEELEKQEQEKAAKEKALAEQKEAEQKAVQEKLLAELKTEEEKAAKKKTFEEQGRVEKERDEQERLLAVQKAAQEKRLKEEEAEKENIGKTIPLLVETGVIVKIGEIRKVEDSLTSEDFPIKYGQDFHFPGLVERGYFNWMGVLGSRKWMPYVGGFEFNGLEIVVGGKSIIISKEEAIKGFDIKKEDLQYKNLGEKAITIRPQWQRIETKQKSQETASEVALQAAQIASTLAIDTARITTPDKLAQLPLAVMSKFMSNMSEFENYQTEQIKIAQGSVTSLNYYMDIDDSIVLDMITNSLPFDVKGAFSKNVSISEDTTPGVVMSFNPGDGKIHVSYKMLRAMFFDEQGNIKNKDLLEVFVKHELRHRDYALNQDQLSKMVHNINALEEFIVSMGDIYDWINLHPELTNLQINYEDAIATVMANPALVAIAAKVGRQEAFNIAQMQSRLYYREIEDQVIDLVAPVYTQEPSMFNDADAKKSPRLIAVGGQIGAGSSELIQAQVLKDGGYSAALVEHMTQGVNVENYRMPVNTAFSVDGHEMVYDVYVREVEGVHVIGLKLKGDINKGLDTLVNYAKA